jgi:predicted Zn finger-like uncharacterized protein
MVVECPKCKSKYQVRDSEVPTGGAAVRCLECSNIFTIYKDLLNITLSPFKETDFEPSVSEVKEILRKNIEPERKAPVAEKPSFLDDTEKNNNHRKAERLGQALVKDIYLYHKDKVEQGRREGTLVQLLGEEIKKSWRFYKKQVDPEVLKERNYFKDALNEIIAGGKEVFK